VRDDVDVQDLGIAIPSISGIIVVAVVFVDW
jgi:hypothetical protein